MVPIKFGSDIPDPLWMNSNPVGYPLTFHLAMSSGQDLNSSNTLICDQISAEQMPSPTASADFFIFLGTSYQILAC